MIDLTNTCVLVKTKEENERLLKEAEKQGFHWHLKNSCEPFHTQRTTAILYWTASRLQRLRILRTLSRMFSRHAM